MYSLDIKSLASGTSIQLIFADDKFQELLGVVDMMDNLSNKTMDFEVSRMEV